MAREAETATVRAAAEAEQAMERIRSASMADPATAAARGRAAWTMEATAANLAAR